jgi:hypothetical protein
MKKKWKKRKKVKKSEKTEKIDLNFASSEVKRKIWSEKKRKKISEILYWNSETQVKRIQIRFIALISEKNF